MHNEIRILMQHDRPIQASSNRVRNRQTLETNMKLMEERVVSVVTRMKRKTSATWRPNETKFFVSWKLDFSHPRSDVKINGKLKQIEITRSLYD